MNKGSPRRLRARGTKGAGAEAKETGTAKEWERELSADGRNGGNTHANN